LKKEGKPPGALRLGFKEKRVTNHTKKQNRKKRSGKKTKGGTEKRERYRRSVPNEPHV